MKSFFIASTKQHVGKTTLSLGLFSGLKKRGIECSYMKPVGQEMEKTESGVFLDKDVRLIKKQFEVYGSDECMSPVLIPPGFTKDFLDKKIDREDLVEKILTSYQELIKTGIPLLVEGTGHMGVGSIINLNNAQVASELGIPVILIASGGLGSAFDELTLNKTLCDLYEVPILGVVLNRVLPEKKEMITTYIQKALEIWNIPLLGCIPLDPLLAIPSMCDLQHLFKGDFLSGEEYRLSHFTQVRLVAASAPFFKETLQPNQLIITPAHREDIITATLAKFWEYYLLDKETALDVGMILTGDLPPRSSVIEGLKKAGIPAFYTSLHSDKVHEKINSFTAKIQKDNDEKIQEAMKVVEENLNFDLLLKLLA